MSAAVAERPKATAGSAGILIQLREKLGWSRSFLALVMNCSDRALVNWEQGEPMSAIYAARLRELQDIHDKVRKIVKPKSVGDWLKSEMEEFAGRSPADLIQRGETGWLWESLYFLQSGQPD